MDNSPEITRTKTYHDVIFFGGYIKSLQNMIVTLNSILKCTEPSMEDYEYLKAVIVDIERLSAEVDTVHGETIDHQKLVRFANQLILDLVKQLVLLTVAAYTLMGEEKRVITLRVVKVTTIVNTPMVTTD